MDLWIFTSTLTENINIGYRERLWAISDSFQDARVEKSRDMAIYARGIIWDVQRGGFTMPFRTASLVDTEHVETSVWPDQRWSFPFKIHPLVPPDRRATTRYVTWHWSFIRRLCPEGLDLQQRSNLPTYLRGMQGGTVFTPNELASENEWHEILRTFGDEETVREDNKFTEPLCAAELQFERYNLLRARQNLPPCTFQQWRDRNRSALLDLFLHS